MEISNIQFKNGTSEWDVKGKVKRSQIDFDLPIGLPIPEMNRKKVLMDDFDCNLTLTQFHPPPRSKSSMRFSGQTFYENDRWGRSYLTRVRMEFEHSPPIDLHPAHNDQIFEKSLLVINRVLRAIRVVLNKFVVHKIIKEDIESFVTRLFDEKGTEIIGGGKIEIAPANLKAVIGGFQFKGKEESKLTDLLLNKQKISLQEELLQNAEDYLFLENFRASVIEAESAFETLVIRILRDNFIKTGDSEPDADNKLEKTPFKNLLTDHLKKYTKSDFTTSPEYKNWNDECYSLRNKIVHSGLTPIESDVQKAITVTKDAIQFLEQIS